MHGGGPSGFIVLPSLFRRRFRPAPGPGCAGCAPTRLPAGSAVGAASASSLTPPGTRRRDPNTRLTVFAAPLDLVRLALRLPPPPQVLRRQLVAEGLQRGQPAWLLVRVVDQHRSYRRTRTRPLSPCERARAPVDPSWARPSRSIPASTYAPSRSARAGSSRDARYAAAGLAEDLRPLRDAFNYEPGGSRPHAPARAGVRQPGPRAYVEAARLQAGLEVEANPRDSTSACPTRRPIGCGSRSAGRPHDTSRDTRRRRDDVSEDRGHCRRIDRCRRRGLVEAEDENRERDRR